MQITADSVLVFSDNKTDFTVSFKTCKTVNYMTACFFKLGCPLNVIFFVKTSLKLNEYGNLLAVFGSLNKCRNDRRVTAYTV